MRSPYGKLTFGATLIAPGCLLMQIDIIYAPQLNTNETRLRRSLLTSAKDLASVRPWGECKCCPG